MLKDSGDKPGKPFFKLRMSRFKFKIEFIDRSEDPEFERMIRFF
jgi:hypothetical protein